MFTMVSLDIFIFKKVDMCYQGMKMKQKLSKTRTQEALKKEQTWQNG